MEVPQAAADFYRGQQRRTILAIAGARRAWRVMGVDFDPSWSAVGPRLLTLATAAQLGAARAGAGYVPDVLAETGQSDEPLGRVAPETFAGYAPDGRSLDGLLYGAVTQAKSAVGAGASPAAALAQGGRWLDMAMHTLVADAGRQATGVGITARPRMGMVRMANPPCCSRCAILAGRFYRFSRGFQRHPRCDCQMIPSTEAVAGDFRTDPAELVRRGQVTDLRPDEVKALDDGADLAQVVNARRGKSGLRGLTTTQGTTRHGLAGQRLQGQARLTPEGIYAQVGDDRAKAVELLKQHGYLI